jgi:ribosomal protein S18 acetylase RimI-like enzyme
VSLSLRIRQVRPADLAAAHAVEVAAFEEDERDSLEMFRRRVDLFSEGFLVAEEGTRIVGVLNTARTDDDRPGDPGIRDGSRHLVAGRHVVILTVATLATHRGRGVATALLREITARARLGRIEKLLLYCREDLVPFYRRHGFSLVGPSRAALGRAAWFDMERDLRERPEPR